MICTKEKCFENIPLNPIYPCANEDLGSYDDVLTLAVNSARVFRRTVETIYFIEDYCEEEANVIEGLNIAVAELQKLRPLINTLLTQFELCYFACDFVYPGLVRAFVIAKFVQRLYCYVLSIDFCIDSERMAFLLDTLRRSSIDADIILNELIVAEKTFIRECK